MQKSNIFVNSAKIFTKIANALLVEYFTNNK